MPRCTFHLGKNALRFAVIFVIALVSSATIANAGDVPQSFTLDGRLFSDAAGTTALTDATVGFRVQILDEAQTCVLYEERQTVNTLASKGYFSVQVGSNVADVRRTAGDSGNSMSSVFQNLSLVSGKLLSNGSVCNVGPAPSKRRYVRILIAPTTMGGTERTLSPDLTIDSVPNAIVAERAESLQGLRGTDFLKVNTASGSVLTQTNLENVFTSLTRFNALTAVVDGTSTNYMRSNSAGGAQLPVITGAPTSPSPGSVWYDTTDEKMKYQSTGGPITLGTGGGVTSVGFAAPTELTVTGAPVTGAGTITVAWASQTANKVFAAPNGAPGAPTFRALVAADIPALTAYVGNAGGTPSFQSGLNGSKGSGGTAGRVWISTDTKEIYRDNGATWDLLGSASASPTGAAGGDLSGTYPNPGVAKIQGVAVSATTPLDGQVLKYVSGTPAWTPSNFSIGDLKTAGGAQQFAGSASCAATQTLTWSSLTNAFTCSNITFPWTISGSDVYRAGGNVGIGTTTPALGKLDIDGGTQTTSLPIWNGVQTWNAGAVSFTAAKINVTDTTSAATSKLLDLQVGGVSKFSVDKSGKVVGDGSGLTGISGSITGLTTGKIPKAGSATTVVDSVMQESASKIGIGGAPVGTNVLSVVGGDASINGLTLGKGAGAIASNTVLGNAALPANTTGTKNVAIGNGTLTTNTTGGSNTAVGDSIGAGGSGTGSSNTAVGSSAMKGMSSSENTAIGDAAMFWGTTGNNNTALGKNASVGTGTQTYSNSTFIGHSAGNQISTGTANTTLGYFAGGDITTGSNNTILGQFPTTAVGITTGSNNIIIGQDVRPQSQTASNQMNIGNLVYATGLGSGVTAATGSIGIGVAAPTTKLDVNGTVKATAFVGDGSGLTGISGAITGLTAGAIPKATSATTVGNSVLTDTSGKIGINSGSTEGMLNIYTSTPMPALVVENGNSSDTRFIRFNDQTTPATNARFDVGMEAFSNGNYFFIRNKAGTDLFNIQHTGNVGIGQNSPTNGKLDINGGTQTTSLPIWNGVQTWNAGAVSFTAAKINVTDTASAATSKLLDLQVGGVSKFSVDKTGKVVGDGSGLTGISGAISGLTTNGVPYATSATAVTTDNTNFSWDATNKRLGIGTNAPAARLHIQSTTADIEARIRTTGADNVASLGLYSNPTNGAGTKYFGNVSFNDSGSSDFNMANIRAIRTDDGAGGGEESDITFETTQNAGSGFPTERMRIDYAGRVGIGTSTPTGGKLDIDGGTRTTSLPIWNGVQTWNAGAVAFTAAKINVTNTASAAASKLLDLQVGGVSKFSVDKTGKVVGDGSGLTGITSTPALSAVTAAVGANTINNGNFAQAWNFANSTNATSSFTIGESSASTNGTSNSQGLFRVATRAGSTADPFHVVVNSNTTPVHAISVDPTGKVGIGTAYPSSTSNLYVDGFSDSATGTNAILQLRENTTGAQNLFFGALGGAGKHSWIQSYDGSGPGYNSFLALNPGGGNVGIGTTSAPSPLTITNNGQNLSLTSFQTVGEFANAAFDRGVWMGYDSASVTGLIGAENSFPSYAAKLGFVTPNSSGLFVQNMTIDADGNVGIGPTAPSSKLDLDGALNVRGLASAPSLSAAGAGKIYFDSTSGKFKVSQNGAAYADLVGGGGGTVSGTTGKIAKFTGASAVGDSIMTETTGKIAVAGQIVSAGTTDQTSNSPAISFNNGNSLFVSANCGAFTLSNMADGGGYTFTVKGTSGSCTFSHGADVVHYAGGVTSVPITSHTVFAFSKMGGDVYVTWVTF